tara:strand:- start:4254 stop:4607 length:354 start_codon:yes stop_codon:yes gene_type:complete
MKVELKIENDADLRTYIKDCIKGQVLTIVREEFLEIVRNELERKLKATDNYAFNNMFRDCLKQTCGEILYKECGVGTWNTSFVKPFLNEFIGKAIQGKDWSKLVDDLAKEKVKALIK